MQKKTPLAVVLLVFIDIFPFSQIVTDLAASYSETTWNLSNFYYQQVEDNAKNGFYHY